MYGKRPEQREEVMSSLKEELSKLEDDLKRQAEINGISLKTCTRKSLCNSKSTALYPSKMNLCGSIFFALFFCVLTRQWYCGPALYCVGPLLGRGLSGGIPALRGRGR